MSEEDLSIPDFKMRNDRAFLPSYTVERPMGEYIVVRPIVENLSEVLDVQTTQRDRIVKGEVLLVGPKVQSEIAVGDIVFFSQIQRYEVSPQLWIVRDLNLAFVDEEPSP